MTAPIARFLEAAQRWPDAIALEDDLGVQLSYRDLARRAMALGAGLRQRLGDRCGTVVAIAARNHADHVVAMFGVFMAGHAWLPLNPKSALALNDEICRTLQPALILMDEACKACLSGGGRRWRHFAPETRQDWIRSARRPKPSHCRRWCPMT